MIRAKFEVAKVAEMGYGGQRSEILRSVEVDGRAKYESTGIPIREITLWAVHDDGLAKENASFATATPSGNITFTLNNPALADAFKPGEAYYVNFTKVE